MDSLYLLIPIALVFAIVVIALLFWSINSGQYDDLDNEASRILFDKEKSKSHKDKQS
jgi:cbb3-type cytochrome oxidase maturation protein